MSDCSYYDLKAFAYREHHEWIPVFENKKTRLTLSVYLKSKKHATNTVYKSTTVEAMRNATKAEIEYYSQKEGKSDPL